MVEESINNVLRHADATRMEILLSLSSGGLQVNVTDNGKGFDLASMRPGLGLTALAARFRQLYGSLWYQSVPGLGTTIGAWLPLNRSMKGDRETFWEEPAVSLNTADRERMKG